jgi:uncharacterized protein (TIGR02001 family)
VKGHTYPGLAVLLLLLAVPAAALDGSVDLSLQSAYIWRGMVLNDEPVLQPSVTVSSGGFSASVWGNVDLTSANGARGVASEIDYWAAYTLEGNAVGFTLTYYDYTYPHSSSLSTQEVWAAVTFKTVPSSPSLTVIRDVNVIKGWYVLLTGSQDLGLLKGRGSDGLALTLNVGHGTKAYARGYFPGIGADRVTDYGVRLDWPLRAGPGTLTLGVGYTSFTDSSVYTPGFEGKRANLAGGLVYSIPF